MPFLGDERRADLAAEVGPDRDRLQVRIRRREPARGGDGLVERRVEPAVPLRDQRRQRQQIGVEQLRVLAPLLDHRHDLVLGADPAQDAAVGRVAGLALAARLEAELLEQDPRHLLRRAEHELLAGEVGRERLELLDPVLEPRRDLAHAVGVDLDAGVLHRREHGGERQLDVLVELQRAALDEALAHRRRRAGGAPRRAGRGSPSSPRRTAPARARARTRPRGRRAGTPSGRARSGTRRASCRRPGRTAGAAPSRRARRARRRGAACACDGSQAATTTPSSEATAIRPSSIATPTRPRVAPSGSSRQRDGLALELRPLLRRQRRVELVDAVEQATELEAPEHLLQLRAVGRAGDERRRVDVERQVAAHRRELLRRPRLVGVLAHRLAARGRELVGVRDHLLQRAVLGDQLAGGLVADPRDAGDVVRACRP